MKKTIFLIAIVFTLPTCFGQNTSADIVLYSENFDTATYPNQAPLVTSDGDASTSFTANSAIGATNAVGSAASGGIYASAGAASVLSTRNGTRGYITVADTNFTSGSGNVGQLHSHTAGGFMLISVGPLVNNVPTPIAVTAAEGDVFRVTFDMYVQALRSLTTDVSLNWNATTTSMDAAVANTVWTDYTSAAVGNVKSVSIEFTVSAAQAAGLTNLAPQVGLSNNSGDVAFNTKFMQIDNFVFTQITVAVPEPSSLLLIGITSFGLVARRRRKS